MTTLERWLPVVGQEGRYEVSDLGRVRSLRFRNKWADLLRPEPLLLRPSVATTGYLHVSLSGKTTGIHRIVLEAFVGPCPPGYWCAHENGVRADERLVNLAWKTPSENERDKVRHGTLQAGDRHYARRQPERLARGDRHGASTHPERTQRGEACHSAKLTAADVLEIRRLYATGRVTKKALADRFLIGQSAMGALLSGHTWRHVEGDRALSRLVRSAIAAGRDQS